MTPSSPIQVRDAVLEDLPAIVAIYNSTIPSRMVTADTEPVSVESRLAWFEQHTPARHPLWVATQESQVLGWLSYSPFYGRPAYRRTLELSVYIATDHRGQGLGNLLVERSIRHAPSIGSNTLLGFIFGHNVPSLRLFEKHSFRQWGYLPGVAVLDGAERDLVILGRRV
jgi:phosphinothricin acetyltransferase